MFDWDDEELANIIWGKAGENEDHIVPYPDETHDLPQSSATKWDLTRTDEKVQVDNVSQVFHNQPEDRDGSNFVDYGWANVGSFDDLDRILSNNDLVYGNPNVRSAGVLWSSSKDVIGCSEKSELLISDCEHVESKSRFIKDEKRTNKDKEKTNDHLCHAMIGANTSLENLEHGGCKNENSLKEKSTSEIVRRTLPVVYPIDAVNVAIPDEIAIAKHAQRHVQRKSPKCQKTTAEKCEARQPKTSSDLCFSHGNEGKEFKGHYIQNIKNSSSKAKNQQIESSPYKQFISPLGFSPGYNITGNQRSAVPTLTQFHSGEERQQASSGSSYLSDKTVDTPLMPMRMTPQEKIEKLRKRQKMRALLAIRKQQQEFRQQVSCDNYSDFPKCSHESQMQFAGAGNAEIDESLSTIMSLDATSPLEQSDSDRRSMMMMMDKTTLEDTILHQLQYVIARLDIEIRLCIRDSLFRLAQSALQRRYTDDTVRGEPNIVKEERLGSGKSSSITPDGETKTNPIDRAVAHLLFHTPLSNAKLHYETKKIVNKDDQHSCIFGQENKFKTSSKDALQNASNNNTTDGNGMETEASSRLF